ncbi:MAG: cobalamin B12-binding domain-containing protein, partial [Bacilli bacterium]|nr:cobalamin B12-binding domain-containing protein [Bacilli bacterium]
MKTLLIGINSKYIHPAIGVHQIYTNAESDVSYHEFTIKDNNQTIIDYITSESFDVLGFSVYIWNVEKIKQIIETLECTQYTIILDGPEASYHWQPFSYFKNVCYIIKGEGEIPFNLLIAYLEHKIDFTQVYNVIYRQNN